MAHLKNNVEKYNKIVKAINEALPKGKVHTWLTMVITDDRSFAVMGECSEFDKKIMLLELTLLDCKGDIKEVLADKTEE